MKFKFVEDEPKKFKPFSVTIYTPEQAEALYALLNAPDEDSCAFVHRHFVKDTEGVKRICNTDYSKGGVEIFPFEDWDYLDEEIWSKLR